jgi:hypothetical protein
MAPRLHMVQEVTARGLTVGGPEAWVEVLRGWRRGVGGRGGGASVDRRLGEVRGARYRGECNLISPLLFVLFLSAS